MTTLAPYDRLLLTRHLKSAATHYDGIVSTLWNDPRCNAHRPLIESYQKLAVEARTFVKRLEDDKS